MKAKLSFLVAAFLLAAVQLFAQSIVTDTTLISAVAYREGQYTDTANTVTYSASSYSLGRAFTNGDTIISRTYFQYSLSSIPTNATITQVTVNYSTDVGSFTFKITQLSTIGSSDQANWSAIGNGTSMNTGLTYGTNSFTSSNIKSSMQTALTSRQLILGALSEEENKANSVSVGLSISLTVIYTVPNKQLSFIARNDLDGGAGGNIGVGIATTPSSYPAPYTFYPYNGQTVIMAAYDGQTVNGSDWLFNDIEAPNNKSSWIRDDFGIKDTQSASQSFSFTADSNYNGASYIAYLKMNTKISLNYQTDFDGTVSKGVVEHVVEQNTGSLSAAQDTIINTRKYIFYQWSDGDLNNPKSFVPTTNTTLTADYKGSLLTNNSIAMGNSGSSTYDEQQRIVKTQDGSIFIVYPSMNQLWLQQSTDGSSTWLVKNITNIGFGDLASMSHISIGGGSIASAGPPVQYAYLMIVGWDSLLSSVDGVIFSIDVNHHLTYQGETTLNDPNTPVTSNPMAAVAIDSMGYYYECVWKQSDGLYYAYGYPYSSPLSVLGRYKINSSSSYSTNPAIAASWNDAPYFHVVWSNNSGKKQIIQYTWGSYGSGLNTAPETDISSSISLSNHHNPELTAYTTYYSSNPPPIGNAVRISWTSYTTSNTYQAALYDPNIPNYYVLYGGYGQNNIVSTTNISHDSNRYDLAFVNDQGQTYYVDSRNPANLYNLNVTGNALQIAGSGNSTGIDAMDFSNTSLPYYYTSTTIPDQPAKVSAAYSAGRMLIARYDSNYSYFTLGDVSVDGTNITFPIVKNDLDEKKDSTFLKYIDTEPFNLSSNSKFSFTVKFTSAINKLNNTISGTNNINCMIELVDNSSNNIIGKYNEISYAQNTGNLDSTVSYQINTSGITNGSYKLRMILLAPDSTKFTLADIVTPGGISGSGIQTVTKKVVPYSGDNNLPATYELDQNYPNPFNPSTIINYQIPNNNYVTLKIYDVLGNVVKTLVDGYKTQGKYSVNFDASNLASGVYIYQLRAGNFISTKKLLLLK